MTAAAKEQAEVFVQEIDKSFEEMPCFSQKKLRLTFEYNGVAPTRIPIILLKGKSARPRMWIQAVVHGDEYDGAISCLRLAERLDLHDLNGALILVPVMNPSAFFAYQHGSPYDDNVNLNRVFGENDNHSYSWEYGRFLFTIIAAEADFHIDLHGASKLNTIARYTGTANMGNACDKTAYDIARRTGCDYILLDNNTQSGNNRGRLNTALSMRGIPGIVFENGGGLSWTEEAAENHIASVMQVLFEAGYISQGEHWPESGETFDADDYIYFERDGLLIDYVPIGTWVKKGDVVLHMMNVETMEIEEILATKNDCFIFCIHNAAVCKKGNIAYCLARKTEGL